MASARWNHRRQMQEPARHLNDRPHAVVARVVTWLLKVVVMTSTPHLDTQMLDDNGLDEVSASLLFTSAAATGSCPPPTAKIHRAPACSLSSRDACVLRVECARVANLLGHQCVHVRQEAIMEINNRLTKPGKGESIYTHILGGKTLPSLVYCCCNVLVTFLSKFVVFGPLDRSYSCRWFGPMHNHSQGQYRRRSPSQCK